jgi:hypothetical protein
LAISVGMRCAAGSGVRSPATTVETIAGSMREMEKKSAPADAYGREDSDSDSVPGPLARTARGHH